MIRRLWRKVRALGRRRPQEPADQLVMVEGLPYPVDQVSAMKFEADAEARRPPRNTWRADIGPSLRQAIFPDR